MNTSTRYDIPPAAPAPVQPTARSLLGELTVGITLTRLAWSAPLLKRVAGGDASVILIPGWKAPEASMEPLRRFLRSRGFAAHHWGLGTNRGNPERDRERVAEMASDLLVKEGRPVALVGWSLGGVIARETARLVPEAVSGVVTYGTPAVGGPTYTLAASKWGEEECARISEMARELDESSPIPVPIAAVFTRSDGVVSWPACIDRYSPRVTHFEVTSSHLGMGIDPTVWSIVAEQVRAFAAEDRE